MRALSKAETAARLGTSERTVERFIDSGRIRAHKVGGRWKVFENDLDAFLAQCANVPVASAGGHVAA